MLDIGAIVQSQTANAAAFSNYAGESYAHMKSIKETHGWQVGVLTMPHDMTWLGSGESSSSSATMQQTHDPPLPPTVNNASIFPSFLRLERPGILPGTCRISLNDDDAATATVQSWIQKIWDGECVYCTYPNDGGASLLIVALTAEDSVKLMQCECFPNGHAKKSFIQLHPDLYNRLDPNQRALVTTRMMHHFLRQYAYWIPPFNLGHLLSSLVAPLTSKKCKQQLLDWQILQSRFAVLF
jgi:hypothetical protein